MSANSVRRDWLWLGTGIAAIILAGLFWMSFRDRTYRRNVVAYLDQSTSVAVAAADPASLDRLAAIPEDAATFDYARLRTQLSALKDIWADKGLRGLYLMKIDGGVVRFVVDSAPADDPWHSEPGVVYEEPPAALAEIIEDGRPRFTGPYTDEYGTYYSSFTPMISPDGRNRWMMGADVEVSAYDQALLAQRLPTAGSTLLIAAIYAIVFFVVRNRQQKLLFVRRYTKRLEILIEQMPVGVMIFEGRKGEPTMSNEAAVRLLGKEIDPSRGAAEFVQTYAVVREDGSPYPAGELPLTVTLAGGQPSVKGGMFIQQKDGSRLAVRMASVPIKDEGEKIAAIVAVLEDMTKEHELDRQKTEFISIASHELRAPLTAIKWNTDLLLDKSEGRLNAAQHTYATHINEINNRLVALVNELLNVSRLETGAVGVEPAETDMNELIDGVLKDLAGLYGGKRQKVTYDRHPLPELNIDARLIRQVFTNLISNAVKYSPEGGKITLGAELRVEDVRFTVTDTGIGIPKAQQSQMFKKFFRANNASDRKIEGTGLGLYICRQAVELSGGEIGFESEENRGATFWFTLPLAGSPKKDAGKRLS